jgi:hypothetical protein
MSIVNIRPPKPAALLNLVHAGKWNELAQALKSGAPAHVVISGTKTLFEEFMLVAQRRLIALEISPNPATAQVSALFIDKERATQMVAFEGFLAAWKGNSPLHPTPLSLATVMGRSDMVASLIRAGHDPNEIGEGQTPLTAVVSRHICPPVTLMELRARPATEDRSELFLRQLECLRLLRKAGGDVNLPGANGASPLLLACLAKELPMMMFLLAAGADPEGASPPPGTQQLYRLTPLEASIVTHNNIAAHLLIKTGANLLRLPSAETKVKLDPKTTLAEMAGAMGSPAVLDEILGGLGTLKHPAMVRSWHFAVFLNNAENIAWFLQRGGRRNV